MTETPITVSRPKGHWLAMIGAWMQVAPVLGMIGTVIGMIRAFDALSSAAPSQVGDPSQLSAAIGEVLIATFVGMLIALIGAVLMLVAVFSCRYRSPWLFWLFIVLGLLYLLAFPLGTLIGVVFLVVALTKRLEFLPPSPNRQSSELS
jgi:hypothetical protein